MGNSYSNDFEDPVQLNYSYEFPEPLKPPLAYNFTDSEKQKMKDNHQITQNEIEDMEVADDCSKDSTLNIMKRLREDDKRINAIVKSL